MEHLIKHIQRRIEEIKKTTPEDDEAELYLQGCQEELQRLLVYMTGTLYAEIVNLRAQLERAQSPVGWGALTW